MLELRPLEKAKRFTLRKEYFGGIVHDCITTDVQILTPDEYSLLTRLSTAENSLTAGILGSIDSSLARSLDTFTKRGIVQVDGSGIKLVSTRLVKPPDKPPTDILTAPVRVYDTYTQRCNLSCDHCYAKSEADFKEQRRTLDVTAEIMENFFMAGTAEWRFTGGEPTIYPDIFDAIKIAKELGMSVSLNSNAWWNPSTAERVLSSGIAELVVSLEGSEPVNDARRKKGAFRMAVKNLARIYEHNQQNPEEKINVVINTAVGRDNLQDVPFIVSFAAKHGFDVTFIPLKLSGRAGDVMASQVLTSREFMAFSELVQQLREREEVVQSGIRIHHRYKDLFGKEYKDKSGNPYPFSYSECGALTTAVSLLPDGRVFACPFVLGFPEFIGPKVTEVSIIEAWTDPSLEKFRRAEKTDCLDCEFYMQQCRGKCRATVLTNGGKIEDGKLIGEDPQCYVKLMSK